MKKSSLVLSFFLTLVFPLSAKNLVNVDRNGIGIRGYDPVAYFHDGKPEKGRPEYRSFSKGVTYLFASAEDKAAFDATPLTFAPQFGGYCAYGVSKGALVEIDPSAFQIVNGQLLLQYSKGIMEKFNRDQSHSLQMAKSNWLILVEKRGN